MQAGGSIAAAVAGGGSTFSWGSIVEGGPLQDNEFERRLAAGANIACRLRGAVREQLGERACSRLTEPVLTCMPAYMSGPVVTSCERCYILAEPDVMIVSDDEHMLSAGNVGAHSCVTGYTMSAGIACNKLLAKIASAVHKPNQQTIVPPRCFVGPATRSAVNAALPAESAPDFECH